jgi:DNA-binding MarR family transcriptional regulator
VAIGSRPRLDLAEYLPYLINRVGSALVVSYAQSALDGQQLTIAMWRVLAVLSNGGSQRQVDLADLTSIDASTLSRLVTRLMRLGLVKRSRSASNSREVAVALTPKGRAVVDRLIPQALAEEKLAVAGVGAKDIAILKQTLRQIYRNITRAESERPASDHETDHVAAKKKRGSKQPS